MNAVGRIGSYIYRGVGTVSGPFHPFGGAIDVIVVEQPDGTFKSSPWYVRFGKFQGVLKNRRNLINIQVNGVDSGFNMYLAHTGQAYFLREVGDVASEAAQVYTLSSADEADTITTSKSLKDVDKLFKSKSCNYGGSASSPRIAKPGILGFVFGRRSSQLDEAERVSSIQRAVLAADLLELKWSTNIDTRNHTTESNADGVSNEDDNASIGSRGASTTMLSGTSVESGCVDVCVEPMTVNSTSCQLAQDNVTGCNLDSKEVVLSAPNATFGSIVTSEEESSIGSLVQDENRNNMNDMHLPVQSFESSQSTSGSALQPETEDEQFSFRDLDECRNGRSGPGGSSFLDTVEVDRNPNVLTTLIDIERKKYVSTEQMDRLVESLPITQLHNNGDMEASLCQPLSQSLDLCSKALKGDSREDESSSGVLDAQKGAEGSPSLKAFKVVIDNSELVKLSLCKHLLREGMGSEAASLAFDSEKLDTEKLASCGPSILENEKLIAKIGGCYFPWDAAAPIILGGVFSGVAQVFEPKGMIVVDKNEKQEKPPKLVKKTVRALTPTSEQLASLDLKEGRNTVTFTFSTNIMGTQKVDARIYLWKWNARIVVSDVDGTITRSDVLGLCMPLVGIDWSQTGVTHLFSAVKENGYQLMFLSARAISQASVTRQFLVNLKQDGKALPDGPVVISPDGLFPSLFREVIRRAPHEFKISCLEEIRALFPVEHNPFYAGFGNRDTDEISYLKVGIPRGKIFTINPKGQVAVNRRVDTRSYTNLHSLVNRMFPATGTATEREDFNTWNFWKLPPPSCM